MRRILFAFYLCFVAAVAVAQTTYVLAAGVGSYPNGRRLGNLNLPPKDATAFSKLMKSHGANCALFTSRYATKSKILSTLRTICQQAGPKDRIFFYFAGHGGTGGICPYDENLAYDEIVPILTRSHAQRVYLFIDACHSGSIATSLANNANWPEGKNGDKIVAFCATRETENSTENGIVPQGFFTQGLMKALRGKGDANGDKRLTVMEVFDFVHKDLAYRSYASKGLKQHPVLLAPAAVRQDVLISY